MQDQQTTIAELKKKVQHFIDVRDWKSPHNPKNLSMTIAAEAAELMRYFLWVDGKGSEERLNSNLRQEIEHEISDIVFPVLVLCAYYNIDLSAVMNRKIEIMEKKYPIDTWKGCNDRYALHDEQK